MSSEIFDVDPLKNRRPRFFLPHGYLLPWGEEIPVGSPVYIQGPFTEKSNPPIPRMIFPHGHRFETRVCSKRSQLKNRNISMSFFVWNVKIEKKKGGKEPFVDVCDRSKWCYKQPMIDGSCPFTMNLRREVLMKKKLWKCWSGDWDLDILVFGVTYGNVSCDLFSWLSVRNKNVIDVKPVKN